MQPGIFNKLLLIEPIIYPPTLPKINHLATAAIKRRSEFASLEEVKRSYLKKKDFFALWDERVLDSYITHGFKYNPEKKVWQLKCSPLCESKSFAAAVPSREGIHFITTTPAHTRKIRSMGAYDNNASGATDYCSRRGIHLLS